MAENFSNLAKKTDSWVQEADGSPKQGEMKGTYTKTLYIKVSKVKDALKMKVTQSCPTLSGPVGYTVHGILQARILEWVAVPFSRGSSQPRDRTQVSCFGGRFFISADIYRENLKCSMRQLVTYKNSLSWLVEMQNSTTTLEKDFLQN